MGLDFPSKDRVTEWIKKNKVQLYAASKTLISALRTEVGWKWRDRKKDITCEWKLKNRGFYIYICQKNRHQAKDFSETEESLHNDKGVHLSQEATAVTTYASDMEQLNTKQILTDLKGENREQYNNTRQHWYYYH